jgi:hypothetical protein
MKEYDKTEEESSQLGQESGAKFDAGKSRWDLIPADVMLEVSDEFATFKSLYQQESEIKTYRGKMLFHYSNGMETAWSFWNMEKETPGSTPLRKPLIFSIVSYIHLLDLALLLNESNTQFKDRERLYEMEVPNTSAFYLIPYRVIDYLGEIYLYGCKKYDENNWRKGMEWGKIFAAFNRHSGQWHGGEDIDGESGMHHIGHSLWQLFCLRWFETYKPDYDDRWETENLEKLGVMNQ